MPCGPPIVCTYPLDLSVDDVTLGVPSTLLACTVSTTRETPNSSGLFRPVGTLVFFDGAVLNLSVDGRPTATSASDAAIFLFRMLAETIGFPIATAVSGVACPCTATLGATPMRLYIPFELDSQTCHVLHTASLQQKQLYSAR